MPATFITPKLRRAHSGTPRRTAMVIGRSLGRPGRLGRHISRMFGVRALGMSRAARGVKIHRVSPQRPGELPGR